MNSIALSSSSLILSSTSSSLLLNLSVELFGTSMVAQMVKNACNAGDSVQSLHWEDPLEKGMATHSSILALRIPWTEEPGELQSMLLYLLYSSGL